MALSFIQCSHSHKILIFLSYYIHCYVFQLVCQYDDIPLASLIYCKRTFFPMCRMSGNVIEIDNWLDFMTEFSRYCAYITYVPQTIGFLPRYYRAPLLIGFGRGCPRKTKLWNIIRLDMAYCPSLCKFVIILTLCFLFNFNSQFNSVLNSTFIVIQQYP